MDLTRSMEISAAGMKAQGQRLRVISENLANAQSTALNPGGEPYRRRVVMFRNMLDRELGVDTVYVRKIAFDRRPFTLKYDPGHPAANADGYVQMPNVNAIIELTDMREAQRSYEANLQTIEASKTMVQQTLRLLR